MEYLKKAFQFISDSEVPLYQQLYDYFKRQILTGNLKEGEQIPPETGICDAFKVSRSTVRKAMDMLAEEGLVKRHRGRGSLVMNERMRRPLNYLYNFTENMQDLGAMPSSIVLEAKVLEEAPRKVQEKLGVLDRAASFFFLHRIRCANGEPVLREQTYIPYYLCPQIEQYDFSTTSLYHILSTRYLLNLHHATETLEAVFMEEEDKKLLKCREEMPGFKIRRISFLDTGMPYEYTTSITRSDRCTFQMELYKKPAANAAPVEVSRSVVI